MKTAKKTRIILMILLLSFLMPFAMTSARATNSQEYYFENADGGYISPVGHFIYEQQAKLLNVYAYPYDGFYWVGWNENGTLWYSPSTTNPLQISLNYAGNITNCHIKPIFSTIPHYYLFLNSTDNVYIDINGIPKFAYNLTSTYAYVGGTTLQLSWPESEYYKFTSYLINGTTTITTPSYSMRFNGNTTVEVNEVYTPPTGIPTGSILGGLEIWIIPVIIVLMLGLSFMGVGSKMGDHGNAGFLMGSSIGLVLCGQSGLIPMWIIIIAFTSGIVGAYFWLRS